MGRDTVSSYEGIQSQAMKCPSMRITRLCQYALLCAAGILGAQPEAGAINLALTDRDIQRAVAIAGESDTARAHFHARYNIPVDDATVESIEVITEFRRFTLTAEEQLKLGNWMFARGGFDERGRTMKDGLKPWAGRVSIRMRLRFHPQNTFGSIPPFEIAIGDPSIAALDISRTPIHALASRDSKGGFVPLMGAVVESVFHSAAVGQKSWPVRVLVKDEEIKRLIVDFSNLE